MLEATMGWPIPDDLLKSPALYQSQYRAQYVKDVPRASSSKVDEAVAS